MVPTTFDNPLWEMENNIKPWQRLRGSQAAPRELTDSSDRAVALLWGLCRSADYLLSLWRVRIKICKPSNANDTRQFLWRLTLAEDWRNSIRGTHPSENCFSHCWRESVRAKRKWESVRNELKGAVIFVLCTTLTREPKEASEWLKIIWGSPTTWIGKQNAEIFSKKMLNEEKLQKSQENKEIVLRKGDYSHVKKTW